MFLVGYPQTPEPVITPGIDWHKLTYLVLTCRKTPINQSINQSINQLTGRLLWARNSALLCSEWRELSVILYVVSDIVYRPTSCVVVLIRLRYCVKQWCSGGGTRVDAVPLNIF